MRTGRGKPVAPRWTHTPTRLSVKHGKGRKCGSSRKLDNLSASLDARERFVDARERAAAERLAVVEARERGADVRDRALAERDTLALERDRRALERDAVANDRDRRAAERTVAWVAPLPVAAPASPPVAAPVAPPVAAPAAPAPAAGSPGGSSAESRPEPAARSEGYRSASAQVDEDAEDPALERARLEAQLQRAHLDGLTGAYRREVGRLALRNEIERARRGDGRFVLAFVDVDGLKGVNDRDGHAAGDKVLRTLAATMRANLRTYDPIVRYGGDEFVCGVAAIDPDEVQHRLGVIDQSLRNVTGVGITAGLASMTGNETLEELTERADAALLEAKRSRYN